MRVDEIRRNTHRSLILNKIAIQFLFVFIEQRTEMFECLNGVRNPLHCLINVRMKNGLWIQKSFGLGHTQIGKEREKKERGEDFKLVTLVRW